MGVRIEGLCFGVETVSEERRPAAGEFDALWGRVEGLLGRWIQGYLEMGIQSPMARGRSTRSLR